MLAGDDDDDPYAVLKGDLFNVSDILEHSKKKEKSYYFDSC